MAHEKRLDLLHLQRIQAVLDGLPGDIDVPHAIIAVEDAYAALMFGLACGLTVQQIAENARATITREETRRVLQDARQASG